MLYCAPAAEQLSSRSIKHSAFKKEKKENAVARRHQRLSRCSSRCAMAAYSVLLLLLQRKGESKAWQWHDGKGVASSSDCCVASRVATNDQKADGMHALALLNRELLLCLCKSAALCRTKKKKKAFLFTAAERQSGRQHAPYLILVLHAFMLVGFLSLP